MKVSDFSIAESFDSEVQGKLIRATSDLFTTEATIGNRKIVFNATALMPDEARYGGAWEIEFTEKTPGNTTYGKTGSGNEMQVFSFVIMSIKELVSRYKPSEIMFGSHKEDGNRSQLYKRMINKIRIPGYHPAEVKSDTYTDTFSIVQDTI